MKVVVETPKYSFTKYKTKRGKIVKDFVSPLPNLFTYGYIKGTLGEDGMEEDAIILDGNHKPGEEVEVMKVGVVKVVDDGKKDDKTVTSTRGKMTSWDKIKIRAFFSIYLQYKKIRYQTKEGRKTDCRYLGLKEPI